MQSEYYNYFLREKKQTLFSTDYAINNRLTPFISMQNHYNLIYREEEREMMPTLKVGRYSRHCDSRNHYDSQFFPSTLASVAFHGLHSRVAPSHAH
jgi:hypothetical protein